MSEPQYRVGQTVYYINGRYGEHECRVMSVGTERCPGSPYTEPVYTITWKPTGCAAAHESELSAEPKREATNL